MAGHILGQTLGGVVQGGEVVAPRGQEPSGLRHRIGRLDGPASGVRLGGAVSQGQLFLLIGGVEPQQGLGDARKIGGRIAGFEGRQVDVGEHRVFQHRLQPGCVIGIGVAGQGGHIDAIGLGQAQQHLGAERAVVAFQKRDIGGRHLQVRRHVGLGQAEVPAHPSEIGAHIEAAFAGHDAYLEPSGAPYNLTSKFCKV